MTNEDKKWVLRVARLTVETLGKLIAANMTTRVWFDVLHGDFDREMEEMERELIDG